MRKFKISSFIKLNLTTPLLFIITFTFILSMLLVLMHRNSVNKQLQTNELLAHRYSKMIELKLEGNIDFLNLLAIELTEGNLSESAFQNKIKNYLKNHPEFINITWVDSNFTIKSVCPLEGNSHIIGLNIELPIPKRASRLAKEKKETIYTQPFEAIQGESSFEAWNPVFSNDKFMGLFAAVYSSNDVINTSIEIKKYSNANFSLLDIKNVVIAESPNRKFDTDVTYSQQSLTSLNNGMKLQVKSEITSPFTPSIIVIVLLLCLLILGITYALLQLNNKQSLLQKKEKLLLNQNSELIISKEKTEVINDRFNKAMLATFDGLWDWNLITNDIYYSPRWKSMLGYADHELPNDFSVWEKLTDNEDVKKSWELHHKLIEGKLDKSEQAFKMLHKKGHWVDILSRATAFFDKKGKAYRVVGTHTDVTEINKGNILLEKSEERFRKMSENMPSGVAIYLPVNNGNDFKFISVNKRTEEITNSSRKDLIGRTLLEKFPKMKNTPLVKALKKISEDGIDIYIPPFYYKDNERQGWRENYIYKLNTGEIIAIFKDVTKMKEVEETLKVQNIELIQSKEKAEESESKFRALFEK